MVCKKVVSLLSEFFDEALDADTAIQVSQHLDQCPRCRKEYDSLSALQRKLLSLREVTAPDYLGDLIKHRLVEMQRNSWRKNLQNELERRWSIIRTLGGQWYITKALGTVVTSIFFILISSSTVPPAYMAIASEDTLSTHTPGYSQDAGQRSGTRFVRKSRTKSDPAINDLCLYDISESMSQTGIDDTFFVMPEVDSNGYVKNLNVLEAPSDSRILDKANEMIASTRLRPASEDGKAVSSHIVFSFSTMTINE